MESNDVTSLWNTLEERLMAEALKEAYKAIDAGEVPVGAVIFHQDKIIARAHNQVETLNDATAHAEIIAITQASAALSDWRLTDAVMAVTKEPCPMCAGAIVNSRISKLIFGLPDPKAGSAGSMFNIVDSESLNHRVDVISGVKEEECKKVIQDFFIKLRNKP